MSKFKNYGKTDVVMLLVFLFLMTALAFGHDNGPVNKQEDEETLRHIKEVLWPKAYREQDQSLLDRILADEFQMISEDGKWYSKADEMAYIKKNKPSYESFKFIIKRLDIFENGTAVVSGTGIIKGKDKNGPYVTEYQSSNILIKRKGQWKAIASHVSGVKKKNK